MNTFRFRLIDSDGSELGIVGSPVGDIEPGDTVQSPDGRRVEVIEVYDDEFGREGGVVATLVVHDSSDGVAEPPSEDHAEAFLGLVDSLGLGAHRDEIARLAEELRGQTDDPAASR
jgi:hypothetical protein